MPPTAELVHHGREQPRPVGKDLHLIESLELRSFPTPSPGTELREVARWRREAPHQLHSYRVAGVGVRGVERGRMDCSTSLDRHARSAHVRAAQARSGAAAPPTGLEPQRADRAVARSRRPRDRAYRGMAAGEAPRGSPNLPTSSHGAWWGCASTAVACAVWRLRNDRSSARRAPGPAAPWRTRTSRSEPSEEPRSPSRGAWRDDHGRPTWNPFGGGLEERVDRCEPTRPTARRGRPCGVGCPGASSPSGSA